MPAEAKPSFSLAPGEVLAGRYEIESGLGTGAMGEVYAARDLELREAIAIKLLRPEIARNERVLERFKREIQLARRVTHPNVCRVFDLVIDRAPRRVFLTMERLSGPTLADYFAARGALPLEEALAILGEVAAGLDAAHAAGIVHRDLKTANVILAPPAAGQPAGSFRVVLTDFGVAWSEAHGGGPDADHLTASGQVVGSPAYMAPEQLRGLQVSPQTDIYALGVLGYELITGRLPFEGETAFLTALKRIEEDPIPPEQRVSDLPAACSAALLRALARRPEDRFASAGAMMRAFAGVASGPGGLAAANSPAAGRRTRRRAWAAAALVLGLALAAAIAWWWRPEPGWDGWLPAQPPRSAEAALLFRNGLAALGHDDLAAARAFFEGALAKEPEQPAIAFALGEAWERLGHSDKSRQAIALACRELTSWPADDAARCRARQAEQAGRWAEAIATYETLLAAAPGDFDLALRLLAARLRGGEVAAAEAGLARLRAGAAGDLESLRLDLLGAEIGGAKSDFKQQQELARRAERAAAALALNGWRARALFEAGSGALGSGDYETARRDFEAAVRLASELGDLRRRADAARKLGIIADRQGDGAVAERRFREAEESFREIGDLLGEARVANDLGTFYGAARRFAEAEAAYKRARELMRQVGYPRGEAVVLLNSGSLPFRQGDLELARQRFAEALPLLLAVSDRQSAETAEHNLANIAWRRGDLPAAAAALEALAERHRAEARANYLTSQIFQDLAEVELARGRRQEAETWAARALELRTRLEERAGVLDSRRLLAELSPAPAEALAALAGELAGLHAAAKPEIRLRLFTALARARLDQDQPEQAREPLELALRAGGELASLPWELWPAQFLAARLAATPEALAEAEAKANEAADRGLIELELLGRLELALARRDRHSLGQVRHEARRRGFLALAERAAAQARWIRPGN